MKQHPTEFWISVNEPVKGMNNKYNLFTASEIPSDRDWLHVIDYSLYKNLQDHNVALIQSNQEFIDENSKLEDEIKLLKKELKDVTQRLYEYQDAMDRC